MEKLLNAKEISAWLRCSPSFAYELMKTGRLKHYVLGKGQGGKRCSVAQVLDYLTARERGGVPTVPAPGTKKITLPLDEDDEDDWP